MHTKNTPEYQRTLRRWAQLTRVQDERGLTTQEGGELLRLGKWLHAADVASAIGTAADGDVDEASSMAALTDDYVQLLNMGDLGGTELL